MHCSIYKGRKAPDHYLFLPCRDDFGDVPQSVLDAFGPLEPVLDLVLTPDRQLACIGARELMRRLLLQGCHVQLPPKDDEPLMAAGGANSPGADCR